MPVLSALAPSAPARTTPARTGPTRPRPGWSGSPARPRCADRATLFQSPALEEPTRSGAGGRTPYARLVAAAAEVCGACPLLASCLYGAVTEHDVAGFVGGTTEAERATIRARLGVTVEPENLDTLAGVTRGGRQVDHDAVVRMRQAHPDESLETLAYRLGCSLSTVKRHLRRARQGPAAPARVEAKPTVTQVLAVADQVTAARTPRRPVAAA